MVDVAPPSPLEQYLNTPEKQFKPAGPYERELTTSKLESLKKVHKVEQLTSTADNLFQLDKYAFLSVGSLVGTFFGKEGVSTESMEGMFSYIDTQIKRHTQWEDVAKSLYHDGVLQGFAEIAAIVDLRIDPNRVPPDQEEAIANRANEIYQTLQAKEKQQG